MIIKLSEVKAQGGCRGSEKERFYRVPQRDVENQREVSVKTDGLWVRTRTRDLPNTNEE
jgi:hypothetical protein